MARFDIIGKRKIWYAISSLLIIASLFFMVTRGFNMGIDFTGGTIMDLRFEKAVNINDVRAVLNEYNLSNSTIQLSGESSSSTESENVMIRTVDLEEQERKEVMAALTDKLGAYQVLREEKVGATMGTELIMNAIYATIISWLLIIAYVSYRFEFKFGISAVLGLAHNVIIVLGAFALTQRQIDSSFVAALLTIIGYSINDTIVIFDRIRENLKLHFRKNGDIVELVNTSIYQTMTRSIYTVSTVLFATFALYFFGGDTTKDFAFALLIGFFCGAYTSIFIASPLWVTFRRYSDKKRLAKRMADTGK
jgi:preprotein translocase subunit SecF